MVTQLRRDAAESDISSACRESSPVAARKSRKMKMPHKWMDWPMWGVTLAVDVAAEAIGGRYARPRNMSAIIASLATA